MHMYWQYLNKHNLIVLMLEDQTAAFRISYKTEILCVEWDGKVSLACIH